MMSLILTIPYIPTDQPFKSYVSVDCVGRGLQNKTVRALLGSRYIKIVGAWSEHGGRKSERLQTPTIWLLSYHMVLDIVKV